MGRDRSRRRATGLATARARSLSKSHKRTSFEDGFIALQETLPAAVCHALEDPAFAAVFAHDSSITVRWPVTVQKRGGRMVTM